MSETPQNPPKPSLIARAWPQFLANRRRIGTAAAAIFALFLAWHVVNGRNGLTNWQQKRSEDKALAAEIERLTEENGRLSQHVDHLKSDPGAIEYEARQRLHYVRPNEVVYPLPNKPELPKPSESAQ